MSAARPTLYLVDSMSNIHRAYHAIQRLSTSAGQPTNAVYGFVTMLRKMVREHNPDLLAAAWDGPQKTQRHEAYADYKANRPAMADDLAVQLPEIREALAAYRIPVIELPGFEADDVIGTLAKKAEAAGYDVVIVTADKDMLQLVSGERIRVFHTGKEIFLDDAGVAAFFGVPPGQVADVLALMGDSVDNVPGVPGVGQVTAKKWITQYGSLAGLLEHADEIKGKVGESLREHREDALLSRRLVDIPVDLPVPFEPDALRRSEPDYGRLKDLFVRLEFHSLAAEIQGDSAVAPEISSERLAAGQPFPGTAGRAGVALLWRGGDALLAVSGGGRTRIAEESAAAIAARWKALEAGGGSFAMGDAKPLDALLARAGATVSADVFDVCLAQYVLAPGVASAELEPMAFQRLGQRLLADKEAGVTACALPGSYEIQNVDRWLAERASAAEALAPLLAAELATRPALDRLYREIERPLTPVLARMELAGVAIDVALLKEISTRMEGELRALERQIWDEAGEEFNVNSPVKLGQILFEKLQYPVLKKTAKTRTSSTGFEVLTELAEQGLTLPRRVLEFREISKLKGTYVDALPALADAAGRVHSSFRQNVAATGRLSSSDPNLQNIPIRTTTGREIRKAFVAPPGSKLVVADYSQIELRILAHLSGDAALIRAFEEGQDIHRATAARIFGVAPDLVSQEMRFAAKRINFALLYGMAAFTLGKELGVSTSEARSYVDSYFNQFPSVRACLDGVLEEARRTREVTTLFGRVRPIPDIAASNGAVRANAERMALNAPFQGTAADIIKIAMIRLDDALRSSGLATRLVLQVHDELVLEAPDAEIDRASALVRETMEGAATLKVRLAVDVGTGRNWLEAK
ncbi:MAG TPA: DNA polymerase I [Thermoanaerobaculia bacterium]|nr:DNA polymerase I [Thermoanaerobaculia bacterium]